MQKIIYFTIESASWQRWSRLCWFWSRLATRAVFPALVAQEKVFLWPYNKMVYIDRSLFGQGGWILAWFFFALLMTSSRRIFHQFKPSFVIFVIRDWWKFWRVFCIDVIPLEWVHKNNVTNTVIYRDFGPLDHWSTLYNLKINKSTTAASTSTTTHKNNNKFNNKNNNHNNHNKKQLKWKLRL